MTLLESGIWGQSKITYVQWDSIIVKVVGRSLQVNPFLTSKGEAPAFITIKLGPFIPYTIWYIVYLNPS